METATIIYKIAVLMLVYGVIFFLIYQFKKSKYFIPFLKKFSGMLKESKEDNLWSTTRFYLALTVILSNSCIWFTFITLSIWNGEVAEVPFNTVLLYCVANGIAGIVKVLQKKYESPTNDNLLYQSLPYDERQQNETL